MILLNFTIVSILLACSDNFEQPVKGSPNTEVSLNGSFESKFNRYTKGDSFTGSPIKIWSDTVWQNDRTHKQLILWTEKEDIKKLTYQVSDLKGEGNTISKNNIKLYFASYIKGDNAALECGMQGETRDAVLQADALSPISSNLLSSDDPLKIWLTLNVPSGTTPGRYKGAITVKAAGVEQDKFEIDILVVNHELPSVKDWAFNLDLWQFPFQLTQLVQQNGYAIELFSAEYYKMMKPFYTMLADAGQTTITTYIKDGAFNQGQTMVYWTKKTDGSWDFEYSDFDKYVETLMQWGITKQISCFSLVGWNNSIGYYDEINSRQSTLKLDIDDLEYATIWDTFLSSFYTHLSQKGWFDKTVLYMDEIEESKMEKVIDIINKNNTGWKIGLTGKAVNSHIAGKLYDYSIILGHQKTAETPVSTFYTSCSNTIPNNYVTPQNSPAEMTWMAWHAAANGYNGYLRWAYDYWTNTDPTDIHDGNNTAGDFSMIYRSDNTLSTYPISSIRLELLREGIQDYEKIKILSNSQVNSYLIQLNESSGSEARNLVEKGQSLLKSISIAN